MSLRVIGHKDGRRVVVDEGENRARVTGYGGSLIHHALTVPPPTRPRRIPRQPLAESRRAYRTRAGAPATAERRDAVEAL